MQLCVNLVALLHPFYKETDIKLIAKSLVEHLKLAFTCHKLRSEKSFSRWTVAKQNFNEKEQKNLPFEEEHQGFLASVVLIKSYLTLMTTSLFKNISSWTTIYGNCFYSKAKNRKCMYQCVYSMIH